MDKEKCKCWKCGKETIGTVTMDDGKTEIVYSLCMDCMYILKKDLR